MFIVRITAETWLCICTVTEVKGLCEDCRRVFTFGRVVHEEALKQLVLDGSLLCRVIGQDVFMAHIVQT